MISRSDFESIAESASSLDYDPRGRVQGSIFVGGGDPYLRISKDTEDDILRDATDAGGPDKKLKEIIEKWRAHAQDFKTSAGFRKASRGQVDPRRFALHLSRIAFRHAQQYGSRSLFKISKRLKWAASQSRQAAEAELQKISNENDDPEEYQVGRSRIEKPGVPPVVPQWGAQGEIPGAPEENPYYPGSTRQTLPDQSWSAEQPRTGSRRRAKGEEFNGEEPNSDLVQYALDFLEDYISTNSLADDKELLDKLNESDVFESWEVDLENRGVLADDSEDLNTAWNQALSEMTKKSPESDGKLPLGITMSRKTPTDDPHIPGPTAPAPGGDPFNSVLDPRTSPGLDRYIKRKMHSHKNAYNWANNFIADDYQSGMDHFLRRTGSKSEEEEEVIRIANQFLDGAAGALTPDQIAGEDVEQFVEENYPDADHKKVFAVIAEITDPKKRHDKEKERTNDEYRASRPVQTTRRRFRGVSPHYVSTFDTIESTPHRRYSHLQGHREICACCTGTGQEGAGACPRCQGKGRHGLDPDDPQIAAKARVIDRVGSLLLVEIKPQQLSSKGRHLLSRVTNTCVASGNRMRYTHSPELMSFLTGYDVPFKMVGYTHPNCRGNR